MSLVPRRGLLTGGRIYFFEKWYFDGQTDDGAFFFAYLAPFSLLGQRSAELVVSLFPPGGGEHRQAVHLRDDELDVAADRGSAAFRGGELELTARRLRLTAAVEGIELDLRYAPLDPPWTPRGDGVLLRAGRGREQALRWVVPLPRARVSGRVCVRDAGRDFDGGLGYSDFVQTNVSPWKLPLRELLWGRALGEETLAIWNHLGFGPSSNPRPERFESLGLLRVGAQAAREVEGLRPSFVRLQDHPATADRYPVELELGYGEALPPLHLAGTRLLLGEFVADVQDFSTGLERWLYRTFTGNPVEYKLFSAATVAGERAAAAHEWVRWGRNRGQTPRGAAG